MRRFLGQRHAHLSCLRLTFCERQRSLGLVHSRLVIAGIDANQNLAGFDQLVVIHAHFGDVTIDLASHRNEVPVYLGVVRAHPIVVVPD